MYTANGKKYFETLTEAKLELIYQLVDEPMVSESKDKLIEAIKISIEQHDDKSTLLYIIEQNSNSTDREFIQETIDAIKRSPLDIFSVKTINEHATLGAVDSFFPSELLINPTQKMIETRDKVSRSILATLKHYRNSGFKNQGRDVLKYFEEFARGMIFESHNTYPGVFSLAEINADLADDEKISIGKKLTESQIMHVLDKTIKKLESSNTSNYQIMAVHTQVADWLIKRVPLKIQDNNYSLNNNPVYARILQEYNNKLGVNITINEFMSMLRDPKTKFDQVRSFVSDEMMYFSPLYQVEKSRGRGKADKSNLTTTLGVMRNDDLGMRQMLPQLENQTAWVDWTKCEFEPESKIVNSMTSNETPFIASYSGTTSLLLSLMLSGNATTLAEQQSYLCSIIGYVSGVGFHSIHEILAPAAYCIDILPKNAYPVDVPRNPTNYHPPQYNNFYKIMEQSDPELAERRKAAWSQLTDWYRQVYIIQHKPLETEQMLEHALAYKVNTASFEMVEYLNNLCYEPMSYENKNRLISFIREKYIKDEQSLQRLTPGIIFLDQQLKIDNLTIAIEKFNQYLVDKINEYRDIPDELIKLNDKKEAIIKINNALNIDGNPHSRLLSFTEVFSTHRNILEKSRDSETVNFVKTVVAVLTAGLAYALGIFNVKGKSTTQEIDNILNTQLIKSSLLNIKEYDKEISILEKDEGEERGQHLS